MESKLHKGHGMSNGTCCSSSLATAVLCMVVAYLWPASPAPALHEELLLFLLQLSRITLWCASGVPLPSQVLWKDPYCGNGRCERVSPIATSGCRWCRMRAFGVPPWCSMCASGVPLVQDVCIWCASLVQSMFLWCLWLCFSLGGGIGSWGWCPSIKYHGNGSEESRAAAILAGSLLSVFPPLCVPLLALTVPPVPWVCLRRACCCVQPLEYPAFGNLGCAVDCGFAQSTTPVRVIMTYTFANEADRAASSWNLCLLSPFNDCWYAPGVPLPYSLSPVAALLPPSLLPPCLSEKTFLTPAQESLPGDFPLRPSRCCVLGTLTSKSL